MRANARLSGGVIGDSDGAGGRVVSPRLKRTETSWNVLTWREELKIMKLQRK